MTRGSRVSAWCEKYDSVQSACVRVVEVTLSASEGASGWENEGCGRSRGSGRGGGPVQQLFWYTGEELQHTAQHCGPGLRLP